MNNQTELNGPINESETLKQNLIFFCMAGVLDGDDLIQISHIWKKI